MRLPIIQILFRMQHTDNIEVIELEYFSCNGHVWVDFLHLFHCNDFSIQSASKEGAKLASFQHLVDTAMNSSVSHNWYLRLPSSFLLYAFLELGKYKLFNKRFFLYRKTQIMFTSAGPGLKLVVTTDIIPIGSRRTRAGLRPSIGIT